MAGTETQGQSEARITLPRGASIAARARAFVGDELSALGISTHVVHRAKLVASELVTNAFKYGTGAIELGLVTSREFIRVEVVDEGTENVPRIRQRPADETGGWGLQIVDQLAVRWGVFEGTTHVWADLPLGS